MKKINLIFIQWYFLIVNSTPVPDVALILQKLLLNDTYNITSVLSGKHLNSGIAWIQPFHLEEQYNKTYVSKYVPALQEEYNCKIDSNENCTSDWKNFNWYPQERHFANLDAVTDNRWEEFKVLHTDGKTNFLHIDTFTKNNNKHTINFSIRVEKEAHIFLCDDYFPPTSKCYWIILGGNGGTRVSIRKCLENDIINLSTPRSSACTEYQQTIEVLQSKYFDMDSWNHFTIAINERNIILKSTLDDFIFLNYTDSYYNNINIHHLYVGSNQVSAYWKFHTYDYIHTTAITQTPMGPRIKIQDNKLCISLFVAMCLQCNLVIDTLNTAENTSSLISTKTVLPVKEFKWQEVKWSTLYPATISEIQLNIHTQCDSNCERQFWAIDNFRICTDKEVRVQNVEGSILNSSLQIVDSKLKNLNISTTTLQQKEDKVQFPESKCPIGSIGSSSCTNCDLLFGFERPFCDKSIICDYSHNEEGICRCSPGYTGATCENSCPQSYYGYDCKERCGLCETTPCNYITGICPSNKCLSNFEDSQCKTPPYPILKNPPNITDLGNNYITIEVIKSAYYGMSIPLKFKVMYQQTNNNKTLKETELYDFYHRNKIYLINLQSDTSYTIYIVLVTAENKFYDGSLIPKILTNTTCNDIQEEDIIIATTTHSNAVLTFRDKPELCSAKDYQIQFFTDILISDSNNQFHLSNLSSDTNYTLNIKNINTGTLIDHNFRTNIGVSSSVLSAEILSFTATSLTVSWEKPWHPNGLIKYYQINFKHLRHLACNYSEISKENETTLQSFSTNVTLENLIPFSEYTIDIAAVGEAAVGEVSQIRGNTTATDILDEIENPRSVSVQLSSTEANITLEQANCSSLKGDIDYYISARCISDWCLNKISTLNSSYHFAQQELTLTELLPYTMYTIDVKAARKNSSVYKHELEPVTFKTLPTAPYPVEFTTYEKSENMFRIRLVPDDPPRGELDTYIVKYCINHAPNYKGPANCTEKYFEPVRCKIWKKYNCIEISELPKFVLYMITVQARNKNVTQLSHEKSQYRYTEIGESYPPKELSHSWDNFYNVTLQWNHPDITNGPLTKFIITIEKGDKTVCHSHDYVVTEKTTTLTYYYKAPIENKDCYTSELNVTIQSFNIMVGQSATLIIYSPPEIPTLNSEPLIESVSNTTLTMRLDIEKLKFREIEIPSSFMYILLSDSKSKFEIGDVEDSLNNVIHFKTLAPPWRIAKYNLKTEVPIEKLVIGNHEGNNSLENFARSTTGVTLCPNTSYTITILIYNEYQQMKRYRFYEIIKSTSGTTISSNDSSYGPSCNPSLLANGDMKRLEILEKKTAELEKLIHGMSHSNYDMDPLLIFFKDMAMTVKSFEPQLIVEAKSRIFTIITELENRSLQSQQAIIEVLQQ